MERNGEATGPRWVRVAAAAVILAWSAALVLPPVFLVRSRAAWLTRLEMPQAQADWEEFRHDMSRQSGRDGPVQRKVPRSPEPPALVWLRDHVRLAITAWVLFVGVLGGFLSLLAIGVLREAAARRGSTGPAPAPSASLPEDQPRREGHDEKQGERDPEDTERGVKHG